MSRSQDAATVAAQYAAWGVVVRTNKVRGAHLANGLVQLLRLLPRPPLAPSPLADPAAYPRAAQDALSLRYGANAWMLPEAARALAVMSSKGGPLSLAEERPEDPLFLKLGREHFAAHLNQRVGPEAAESVQGTLAAVINADRTIYRTGGGDPTTPGLSFAGFTPTHTLVGMHAATFLGTLCQTPDGLDALRALYDLLADASDPHSQLIEQLGLALVVEPARGAIASDSFPAPRGGKWAEAAVRTAAMLKNLIAWRVGASKAETLMAVVDLASLVLFLNFVQWRRDTNARPPLLLVVAPRNRRNSEAVRRAHQSLVKAMGALEREAEEAALSMRSTNGDADIYKPSLHALSLGGAAGWLFPSSSQGAPKRWTSPGPRQLATLVHCLVPPGKELTWAEFATKAEATLGLIFGGPDEVRVARDLGLGGGVNSIREAGRLNREHLVSLGLARKESDNVVMIDGGGR